MPFWLNYSGTEKQYVAYDYALRLHIGQVECETLIADVVGAIVSNKSGAPPPQFQSCEYLNISICPTTEEGNVCIIPLLNFSGKLLRE